ncbi:MAG: tetratricopeptide repeat protein, partial [Muribaculaceae bacterium]|nr:tetratricopeptide repeat protein [Muribaculaceae bacterium]
DIRYYASAFPEASELYTRAYEANPSSGDYALFQKALMQGFQRDYKGKERTLETFRNTFPTSSLMPDAMLEMTEAMLHQDKQNDAIAVYRELTKDYPSTSQGRQGYLQMGVTLLNMGRKAEAIQAYKDVISLYPTSEEAGQASTFLKNIYANDGEVDEYLAFIGSVDGAPRPDSDETEALNFEAAERDFTRTGSSRRLESFTATYPSSKYTPRALEMLMRNADENGRREEAYEYAETIVSRFPDHSASENALIIKAEEEYDMGRGNAALESWRKLEAKASTPEKVNVARMGIMRVGRDLADYDLVLKSSEAILNSSTAGAEARSEATFSRALALDRSERAQEARTLWESIADNTDDLYGAKSAYYLAESYYDGKEYDKAMSRARAFTGSGTPHKYWLARGFILLSDVYAAQGKDFEAKEYLRALRDNYPGDESDIFEMIDSRLK